MKSLFHKNTEIAFSSVTGTVLDGQEKRSETHISSSGGGGYVGQSGGRVSAPTIHSSVTTKHEFWIELENGTEKAIQLSGCDIPLKTGHKITLVSVDKSKKSEKFYTFLVNHNTKETYEMVLGDQINDLYRLDQSSLPDKLIPFILSWTCLGLIVLTSLFGALVGSIGIVVMIAVLMKKKKRMENLINQHLLELSEVVLEKG